MSSEIIPGQGGWEIVDISRDKAYIPNSWQKVTCQRCGFEWTYKGEWKVIRCPSCHYAYNDLESRKAWDKAYREAHREEIKAYRKAYWEAHREEMKAYDKARNQKPERKAYKKAYYEAHREEIKAQKKAYRLRKKQERLNKQGQQPI